MILSLVFGFISGVALGSFVHVSLGLFLALVVVAVILFFYRFRLEGNNKLVLTCCVIAMVGCLCGIVRINLSNLYQESQLTQFVGQKISAEGIIVNEPDVREHNTKLTVKLSNIFIGMATTSVKEKILITIILE